MTLHQLAILKANTGQIEEAIALYQQSLEIFERIGNAQGKAATLHCLAILKADSGQISEAIGLYILLFVPFSTRRTHVDLA